MSLSKFSARVSLLACVLLLAACGTPSAPAPSATAPATQALIPADPTATATATLEASATVTLPPSAGELALTATAERALQSADPTAEARRPLIAAAQAALDLDSGLSAAALNNPISRDYRPGDLIPGCERERTRQLAVSFIVGEQVYSALVADAESVVLCEVVTLATDWPELFLQTDPAAAELAELARARAARELAADPRDLTLSEARAVLWPDGALGCVDEGTPIPTANPLDGIPGYLFRLTLDEQTLTYHTDFIRVVRCG
jgi:hypothetical protein